jgi:alkylation response protein AidB-like acyl-CoA dehydrogenase
MAGSAVVKHTVTGNAIEAVSEAVALVGNPGLSRRNPLERHLRNVLCSRIHTPQDDTILAAAGRAALEGARREVGPTAADVEAMPGGVADAR